MAEVIIEVRGGLVVSAKAPYGIDVRIIDHDNEDSEGYIEHSHGDNVEQSCIVWSKEDVYEVARNRGMKINDEIASSVLGVPPTFPTKVTLSPFSSKII